MKTMIISAMAAMLSIGAAKANNLTASASKFGGAAVSSTLATYSELSRENNYLKLKVAELNEESAELKSQVEFERMMHSTLQNLQEQRNEDAANELNAKISFQQTMTSVLLKLKEQK